ncbi:MAG TPA: isochorismatase family protein [Marmoricola sp.]|nr:isochorismatase family protein [Marmoricola sp.]
MTAPQPGEHPEDLVADYAAHGFSARLGAGEKLAVLVVDVVRAYLAPGSPLYAGVEGPVAAAAQVVAAARAAGVPVVFTCVRYAKGMADAGIWWHKIPALQVLEEGSDLADFPEEPAPVPGEVVIEKKFASAFMGTSLDTVLRSTGVDTLLVLGVSTSGCVRASVVDAVSLGFRPIVVRDAVGDRDPRPHEAALFDIDGKYGDVVGLDEALALLRR